MAYGLISNRIEGSGDSNGFTTGTGIDTSGANLLAVWIALGGTGTYTGTVTDSKSNTWTQATPVASGLADRCGCWWYSKPTTVGSGHTFTVGGSSTFPTIAASAWSGAASSPVDQEVSAGLVFGNSLAAGPLTPSEDNELVLFGLQYDDNTLASISGGSLVVLQSINDGSFGHSSASVAYEIQAALSATTGTFSWTGGSRAAAAGISFKVGPPGLITVPNPNSYTRPRSFRPRPFAPGSRR